MLRNGNGRGEGLGRRFVALALAEILCFQSLMGTGVAQAIAPSTADVAPVTQVADGAGPESGKDAAAPTDWTRRADAVTVTAPGLELDAEKLQETLDTYNGYCADGVDARFAKPAEYLNALEEGPFYAFEVFNGYFTTVGGIKVTPRTEVLDENDQVIPGLYAGGSDAGGLYGDTYDVGIAAGSQASWAINSGRLAAKNGACYLGKDVQE